VWCEQETSWLWPGCVTQPAASSTSTVCVHCWFVGVNDAAAGSSVTLFCALGIGFSSAALADICQVAQLAAAVASSKQLAAAGLCSGWQASGMRAWCAPVTISSLLSCMPRQYYAVGHCMLRRCLARVATQETG
jgi:hypothetical protein